MNIFPLGDGKVVPINTFICHCSLCYHYKMNDKINIPFSGKKKSIFFWKEEC